MSMEVDLNDRIVCNLQITQCYYEISQAVARFASASANSCSRHGLESKKKIGREFARSPDTFCQPVILHTALANTNIRNIRKTNSCTQ